MHTPMYVVPEGEGGWLSPKSPLARILIQISRATVLGRGGFKWFIARLMHRVFGGPFLIDLWSGRALLHFDNSNEIKAALKPDRYDPDELKFLRSFLTTETSTFVDVGANAGLYTLHIALTAHPRTTCLAIEPNPEMIERIRGNVAVNQEKIGKPERIRVAPFAVSDVEKDVTLILGNGDAGGARVASSGTGMVVRAKTLAQICSDFDIERIDALKIDIEGLEDRVLFAFLEQAAGPLIPKAIVLEHNSAKWDRDVLKLLKSKGFLERGKTHANVLMARA